MNLVPLKCPSCGANLELPADRESAFCTYCGTKILISSGATQPDIRSLIELADVAFDAGNYADALPLYGRVLEVQPRNSHAWMRKSFCTINTANGDNIHVKYKEAEAYLEKAEESDDPQVTEIEKTRVKIRDLMVQFCNVVAVHKMKFAELSLVGPLSSRSEYIEGLKVALGYSRFALDLNPKDLTSIENVVFFLTRVDPRGSRQEIRELKERAASIRASTGKR